MISGEQKPLFLKISDHKFNICMLITLHGEERKEEKNINPRGMLGEFCRRCESDVRLLLALGSVDGCIRVPSLRLNRRRKIEETDGEGGSGESAGSLFRQDVTSVLEHVRGLWRWCKATRKDTTRLPTSSVKPFRGSGTPVAGGREEGGGGGALPCEGRFVVFFFAKSRRRKTGRSSGAPSRRRTIN